VIAFIDLIKVAKEKEYFTWMDTNGIKLGKSMQFCQELKGAGLDRISLTVLTTRPEVYKQLTGANGGTFEYNQRGLDNAVKVFGNKVDINTVFTKKNASDMPALMDLARKYSIDLRILELASAYDSTDNLYIPITQLKQKLGLNGGKINRSTCDKEYSLGEINLMIRSPAGLRGVKPSEPDFIWLSPDGQLKDLKGKEICLMEEIRSQNVTELEVKIDQFLRNENK